jgi:hypothetical protein
VRQDNLGNAKGGCKRASVHHDLQHAGYLSLFLESDCATSQETSATIPGALPEPVVDSGRVAEAAYQHEIEALLAVLFRPVKPQEQGGLERSAGGKQQLARTPAVV